MSMENYVSLSSNMALSCPNSIGEDEKSIESGWTDYLDDLSAYNEEEKKDNSGCSNLVSASMVSDASSGHEWRCNRDVRSSSNIQSNLGPTTWSSLGGLPNMPKKLSFKKKRTQDISYDDSLEDTASSPVNSPKIAMSFRRMDSNSRMADDTPINYMDNENAIDEYPTQAYRQQEFNSILDNGAESKDLKQKGLCLLPVSMVMNYFN